MSRRNAWAGADEPTLSELLSDPIFIVLMERDGLTRRDVETLIKKIRQRSTVAIMDSGTPGFF